MESSNGMNASQDMMSNSGLTSTPVSSTPSNQSEAINERSFKQAEVNDIVKRAKNDAIETYRRQQVQQPEYVQSKYGDNSQGQPSQPSYNQNMSNDEHMRRIAAEEANKTRDQIYADAQAQSAKSQWDRVSQSYDAKISAGKDKYSDFDIVANIDMSGYPAVKQILADYVDNPADLLYELGKDRFKLHQLESMGRDSQNWRDAIVQAQRLSNSIKENEKANKVRLPNEPLSQLRPSITGMDNGAMSIKDLRAKYKG